MAFPGLSYEKVKTGVFDGPQILQLIKDQNFITSYDSCRGHKIVCTGVKFKSCFNVVKNHIPTDSSCYNDSQKVQFDLSTTYRFIVIEEKVRGQIFVSTGVKQVKMLQFCWQWPQNACLVNTIQIQDSFYV